MPVLLELHNDHFDVEVERSAVSFVTAHTEYLRYNKYTDPMSTHLNYFESEVQTPKKNIHILDLSQSHPQNNIDLIEDRIEEYSGLAFFSLYKDLLITNIVDNEGKPLFYKHKTRWQGPPEITFINESEHSIRNMNSRYVDGYLFNDFDNEYDSEQNSYQLVFLAGTDYEGNQRVELLNNESAIAELSWRDINLGELDGLDNAGVAKTNSYTRTQSGNGYDYNVILVKGFCEEGAEGTIYVKYLKSNSIFLQKPSNINQKNSWFLSVNNGVFFADKKYFVPEYDYTNFNPEYGIVKHYDKECYILNKFNQGSIIKTIDDNIILDPDLNLHIVVKVLNASEEVIRVFTSEDSLVESEAELDGVPYESGVLSVDSRNGVILLEQDIYSNPSAAFEEEVKVRADFYSYAKSYVYQQLDINPTFNPDILEYKYFFYLKPNMDFKESIFWIKLDVENNIKDTSDNELVLAAGSREAFFNSTPNLQSFKDSYCFGGDNNYKFLMLGEVTYQETSYIDEATVLDIRDSTPINEETYEDYLSRQHKVLQSAFGYGEGGQVYQENNIIHVTLPKTMLNEYGGDYFESEIYDLLKLKSSPGLEIIFNWEDKKPKLIIPALSNNEIIRQQADFTADEENSLYLDISFEGLGKYQVYRFETIQGFEKENDTQVKHNFLHDSNSAEALLSSGTFYKRIKDSNLEFDKTYFYKIVYQGIYESDIVAFKTRKARSAS